MSTKFSFEINLDYKKSKRAYSGMILHVDLTNQGFWVERPKESLFSLPQR